MLLYLNRCLEYKYNLVLEVLLSCICRKLELQYFSNSSAYMFRGTYSCSPESLNFSIFPIVTIMLQFKGTN